MGNLDRKGWVSQMQSFSVNDGEGIRTTIFLSGCPLRCKWCSNPETWNLNSGTLMSVKQVIDRVKRDVIFFRQSGGGVTFSGGEATVQADFLGTLVDSFYNMGIDTAIETSGYFQWEEVSSIFEKLDFIFIDIKHMDNEKHKSLTGMDNSLILENIKKIGQLEKKVVIRIPFVKGINDNERNIQATARFVREYVKRGMIEILPYHNLGEHKYRDLGLEKYINIYDAPSKEEIERAKHTIATEGVETITF